MRLRSLLVVLAVILSAVPVSRAQSESGSSQERPGIKPGNRKPDSGPQFAPEDGDDAASPTAPEEPPAPPEDPIEALFARLAAWPGDKAREAARRLVIRYPDAKPRIVERLRTAPLDKTLDPRVGAALAWVVAEAGDAEPVDRILAAVRAPRYYRWAADLLDAVLRLDPVRAKERMLPLLDVPSSHVVTAVADRLAPRLAPEDLPALLAHTDGRTAATRTAALALAAEADFAGARPTLVAALGDRDADVALRAATTLGYRSDEAGLADLNAVVRGPEARRGAFAALALVRAGERRGAPHLEDATVAALLGSRGLRSLEPTHRLLGALALADLAYARPLPSVDPVLESEIIPVLVEAAAGTRFSSDLVTLRPLAVERLHRLLPITEELEGAPAWATWWERSRDGIVARRQLNALPAMLRAELSVTVSGSEVDDRERTLSARIEDAPPAGGAGGRFVALARPAVDRLAAAIESSGLLRVPQTYGDLLGDPALTIVVEARHRVRTVSFPEGVTLPDAAREVLAVVHTLIEENAWQASWDRRVAPSFASFVAQERAFWDDPSRSAEERAVRRIRLAIGALGDLAREEDRLAALASLRSDPVLGIALRTEDATALASYAAIGERLTPTGEAALRVLAAAGRVEGLAPMRARLVAGHPSAVLGPLLEETLNGVPIDAVLAAAAEDSPAVVRAAAVASLGTRRGDARAEALVLQSLRSPEGTVRASGYRALGRLRAENAVFRLRDAIKEDPDPAARAGALEGLGLHGGPDVMGPLMQAAYDPDPGTRAAAVRGLAGTREPDALSMVLLLMTSDPDAAVRAEADRAVREIGGDRARASLTALALDRRQSAEARVRAVEGLGVLGAAESRAEIRGLLDDPEERVADAAAFVLAWIRDGAAVPRLLAAFDAARSPARGLRCLELVSLESFRGDRTREAIARLYTGWFQVNRDAGPRGWLASALAVKGIATEAVKAYARGSDVPGLLPVLVRALDDADWTLRRAANLELQRITGATFGDLDAWTSEAQARSVAESWRAWLAARSGADGDR